MGGLLQKGVFLDYLHVRLGAPQFPNLLQEVLACFVASLNGLRH